MPTINPYLNFDGNCEEAFNFYKSVFGGEFPVVMRFKDGPPEMGAPAEYADKVLHVALPIGKGNILMGSDCVPGFGPTLKVGNNFSVSVSADSDDEAKRVFDSVSAGGNVVMPLGQAFWGALFGMAVDKFGVQWMISHDKNQGQS
jgi:PhnB protein